MWSVMTLISMFIFLLERIKVAIWVVFAWKGWMQWEAALVHAVSHTIQATAWPPSQWRPFSNLYEFTGWSGVIHAWHCVNLILSIECLTWLHAAELDCPVIKARRFWSFWSWHCSVILYFEVLRCIVPEGERNQLRDHDMFYGCSGRYTHLTVSDDLS